MYGAVRESETSLYMLYSDKNNLLDLYNALNNRGIHVPTDIALSGFDNLAASIDNPIPITIVEQNYYDIGYNAAKICYESSDFNKQMFTHCILPVKLIKRQSTFKKQF